MPKKSRGEKNSKDIEIEAKFEVLDYNYLLTWLKKQARLKSKKRTVDTYYIPSHRDFLAVAYPYEWLRLREEEGEYSLNYKRWHPENSPKSTHCDEFETTVTAPKALKQILAALDFQEIIKVDKYREKYQLAAMEFSLDNVKDLGIFLEIEYKGEDQNVAAINQDFARYQTLLQTALGRRNYRGYPYLLLEKGSGIVQQTPPMPEKS